MFNSPVSSTRVKHLKWLASLLLILALATTGFSALALPGAFVKSAPANGAINQLASPKLSWKASVGASSYEYCIDTSNNNACNATWKSTGVTLNVTLSGLTPGATYYWQVRAKNAGGLTYANGSSTAWWRFTVALTPPGAFNKTSPANGAYAAKPAAPNNLPGDSIGITLRWAASSLASSYEYCIDTSNNNICNAAWNSTGAATSAALDGLQLGASYYWQVRAKNAKGTTYANGSSLAWWHFTIAYTYRDMTVGFLQAGNSPGWEKANTVSFKETAAALGIRLKYHNSEYNLADQQAAFDSFVSDPEVNVIVLRAASSDGPDWESRLQAAKDAGKVVVLADRHVYVSDSLYATQVSSDFTQEGRDAGTAMCNLLAGSPSKNVVELAGDPASQAAIDRAAGFDPIAGACGITINHQVANWDTTTGHDVMAGLLADPDQNDIQGVFAQNDAMGLGAIQAIKDAALTPGVGGIQIVSIDAIHDAFLAMIAHELNVSVECSPMFAPQVYEAALETLNGATLAKWIPTDESIFYETQGPAALAAILATRGDY